MQVKRIAIPSPSSPPREASDVAPVPLNSTDFWAAFDKLANVRTQGITMSSHDEAQLVKEIGRILFDLIFIGAIRDVYRSSLTLARNEAKGLRIRLRIEAPELAVLPWELLHDDAPLS
jgi:hypothetical protein